MVSVHPYLSLLELSFQRRQRTYLDIRIRTAGKNATRNTILGNNLFKEVMSSNFSHHTIEHHTYEMCQEPLRKYVEEQEKERERDKLRRTEEKWPENDIVNDKNITDANSSNILKSPENTSQFTLNELLTWCTLLGFVK